MGRSYQLLVLCVVLLAAASSAARQAAQDGFVEIEGWDISALDARVAEKGAGAQAAGAGRREKLAAAEAYFERANFFYNAGRPALYKLAVGDFRRVLRLHPEHRQARERLGEIVSIYKGLGRPVPANGEDGDVYNAPRSRFELRPEVIRPAPGAKPLRLSETLPPGVADVYGLDVGDAAQPVSLKLDPADGATFSLYGVVAHGPSQLASQATEWAGALQGGGKYLIKVKPRGKGVRYALMVTFE